MKFKRLSKEAKERARDWYREEMVHDEWWDCVYEDAKECFSLIGIRVDNIYFSGFSCQGGGACFVGVWYASDVKFGALKNHAGDKELHRIAEIFEDIALIRQEASFSVSNSGSYFHKHNTDFSVQLPENRFDELIACNPDFMESVRRDIEARIIEAARDLMDWLYKQLEAEHDYLDSDESVDEMILANDYQFDSTGAAL